MDRKAEIVRVAACFDVATLLPVEAQLPLPVTWQGETKSGLLFTCWLMPEEIALFELGQHHGPRARRSLARVYHGDSETGWCIECRDCGRLPMAVGLYRFGFDDSSVWASLQGVLTSELQFEVRATLPFEFWPARFPDLP